LDKSTQKFFRQFSHYTMGGILTFLGGFVSFPILTRMLTTKDYGLMSLISVTGWLLLALSKGGLQESAVRFYAEFNDSSKENQRTYYATLFWGSMVMAVVLALIVVVIGYIYLWLDPDGALREFIWILAGMVLTGSMSMRMLNFLRAEQRTQLYNAMSVAGRYLSLALSLGMVLIWSGNLKMYYIGVLAAECLLTLVLIIMLVRRISFGFSSFSRQVFKTLLVFGVPLIGYELAYFLMKSIDRYIIQFFLGAEAVGIYSVASNLCNYIKDLILFPLTYTITPLYVELWEKQGREATSKFISRITSISLLVVLPLLFGFLKMGREVIILIASEKYVSSAALLPIIVPATILWGLSPLFAAGMYIEKNTKRMTLFATLAVLLNVLANVILVPRMALMGSAISTLISYGFLYALLAVYSRKTIKTQVDGKMLLAGLGASLAMYGILFLFPTAHNFWLFTLKMMVGIVVYGISLLLLGAEIRSSVLSFARRSSFLISLRKGTSGTHETHKA
jgi:O-antigen/teichoic acid export membrane protein